MRHHAFAAAIGVLTAAVLAPCSPSQAAGLDPTGYWYKPDAERESKIQVFRCGPGKSQLCAKIAWLKDPNDSKGRPLHDIRNEAPSMRDRPIVGLAIFSGLAPSARATASAVPNDAAPLPPENVQAMAEPEAPVEQSINVPPKPAAMPVQEVAAPAPAPVEYNGRSGYGFLNVSASPADIARLSGDDVSSMMVMTQPLAADAIAPAAAGPTHPATRSVQPVSVPDQRPAVKPKPIATAAVKPAPTPAPDAATKPAEQSVPQEAATEQVDPSADAATTQSAEADAAMIEEPPLTRRQRRLLRRQQQQEGNLLPWLR
jgi:hypothetical protein